MRAGWLLAVVLIGGSWGLAGCEPPPVIPAGSATWNARVSAPADVDLGDLAERVKDRLRAAGATEVRAKPFPSRAQPSPGSRIATELRVTVDRVADGSASLLRHLVTAPGRFSVHPLLGSEAAESVVRSGSAPLLTSTHIARAIPSEDQQTILLVPTQAGLDRFATFDLREDGPASCAFALDGDVLGTGSCETEPFGTERAWAVRLGESLDDSGTTLPARLFLVTQRPLPDGLRVVQ